MSEVIEYLLELHKQSMIEITNRAAVRTIFQLAQWAVEMIVMNQKSFLTNAPFMCEVDLTNRAHVYSLKVCSEGLSANDAGFRLETVRGNNFIFNFYFSLFSNYGFVKNFVELFLAIRAGVLRFRGPIVDTFVAELMVATFKP